MTTKIDNLIEENGRTTFTISGIDVSYINAIRRIILSEIPIVVFKTTPYEENKSNIIINTTRLHNEILKQRLSCIPICINYLEEKTTIENYLLELDVENKIDTMLVVTTKDFKILDTVTNTYLKENDVKRIFPPFTPPNGKEYYIEFVHLRPKISEEIPGERIKLNCKFSIGTAKEDSMFNVTGTCSYGFTPDLKEIEKQVEIRKQKWKDEGKTSAEVEFEAKNWKLLEGLRYVIKNSFDFVIESVGIYSNEQLMIHSCIILLQKMDALQKLIVSDELEIKPSENTLNNSYDITLVNEDYTIGNILNYEVYTTFFMDIKNVNYVGFKKLHPHDTNSILRISLTEKTDGVSTVKTMLSGAIKDAMNKIIRIKGLFDGTRLNK